MPDTNTAAAAGFQNADAYEQVMGRWSRRLAPLLIRFGGLSDGDRVLDVGCGTGSLTFTLPQIANVGAVIGVDLIEPYVEFARARNTDPRLSFQSADARLLPFEKNSFDRLSRCWCCNSSPMRPARSLKCGVSCGPGARSRRRCGIVLAVSLISDWFLISPRCSIQLSRGSTY